MIAIIDYDTGNLRSVCNALDRIGAEYVLTDDPEVISKADLYEAVKAYKAFVLNA